MMGGHISRIVTGEQGSSLTKFTRTALSVIGFFPPVAEV
jgi:hypothetical protein